MRDYQRLASTGIRKFFEEHSSDIQKFLEGDSYAMRVGRAIEESYHLSARAVAVYNWVLRNRQKLIAEETVPAGSHAPHPLIQRLTSNLLRLFMSLDDREIIIGDLVEEYSDVYSRLGRRKTNRWFYKQVIGSILPVLYRAVINSKLVAWLARHIRRVVQ